MESPAMPLQTISTVVFFLFFSPLSNCAVPHLSLNAGQCRAPAPCLSFTDFAKVTFNRHSDHLLLKITTRDTGRFPQRPLEAFPRVCRLRWNLVTTVFSLSWKSNKHFIFIGFKMPQIGESFFFFPNAFGKFNWLRCEQQTRERKESLIDFVWCELWRERLGLWLISDSSHRYPQKRTSLETRPGKKYEIRLKLNDTNWTRGK